MTKTIMYCDRCGAEVEYPLTHKYEIRKMSGEDSLDLCQRCHDEFAKWLEEADNETKSQ